VNQERREALLAEFEKSGLSGAEFSRMVGVKYSTFANWRQQWRKRRGGSGEAVEQSGGVAGGAAVRLWEAVVEDRGEHGPKGAPAAGFVIDLPGGCRLVVESPGQLPLAAELVALIAQSARARC
jgi:transposase-like protein